MGWSGETAMSGERSEYVHPELLVDPSALAQELQTGDTRILLLDGRPAEAFAAGHLAGAVHLVMFGIMFINSDPAPMKSFLWIIEALVASRGVSDDRRVVVYDTNSG